MEFNSGQYSISAEKLTRIVNRIYKGEHPAAVLAEENVGTTSYLLGLAHIPQKETVNVFTEDQIRQGIRNISREDLMALLDGTEFKSGQPKGCWFVFGLDAMPYPIGLFDDELAAYKCALNNQGHVVFWDYGRHWDDLYNQYMSRNLPKPNE